MKKDEVEKYEALANELRGQLDAKSAHINRLAMENRELRDKTIPVLEGLLATLSTNEGYRYYRLAQAIAQVLDGAPLGTVDQLGDAWCDSVLEKVALLKRGAAVGSSAALAATLNAVERVLKGEAPGEEHITERGELVHLARALVLENEALQKRATERKKKNKSAKQRAKKRAVRRARNLVS